MNRNKESKKLILKAIHVYWKLYYFILISRVLLPILFIVIWYLEAQDFQSKVIWGTLIFLLTIILRLTFVVRPYRTIGNVVISNSRLFFEGNLVEFNNCEQIELTLDKPLFNSLLGDYFSFYQYGFGNSMVAQSSNQTLIKVNLFIEKKKEGEELVNRLREIEKAYNLNVEILKFKQPTFPF